MASAVRRQRLATALLAAIALAVGAVPAAASPAEPVPTASAVVEGRPDFEWYGPSVDRSSPFIGTLLDRLAVEICESGAGGCAGPVIARFTSTTKPSAQRLKIDRAGEFYWASWQTKRSEVSTDRDYLVRVFSDGVELGRGTIDVVANDAALADVDTTSAIGVVLGKQAVLRFRLQAPTAARNVRINEIESSGGTPGDWVELFNTNSVPFDLSGFVIRDDDDSHASTLPASRTIPAGGFLVIEEADLGFGLGGADAARLFAPDGRLVDTHAWPSHATPTTYGRCPDGTGALQLTTIVTKGAANGCDPILLINEIESSGGTPGDWVELVNAGPTPAPLAGFSVVDADDSHTPLSLPSDVVVPPGGTYVVEELELGFGLGAADSVRLLAPDGSVSDSYAWTAHASTTYGRCPNAGGPFVTTFLSTKGAPNACTAPVTTLLINEVESNGGFPGDWVELVNTGPATVDVSGYRFVDSDPTHVPYVIPAGSTIAPGGYLQLEEAQFGFGLGAADSARFLAPDGATVVDSYTWGAHAATSYGRCPNGTGEFTTTTSVTKGATNDCGNPVRINEVESNGGTPGDWVELINPGPTPVDLTGFRFLDNDDTHTAHVLPAGSTIVAGGYLLLEEAAFGFGLGAADSARMFTPDGVTLLDSYSWTAHATTTYGRCPNGTGAFTTTNIATKGAANSCPGDLLTSPWPGDAAVAAADTGGVFGGNLSGLAYQPSGTSAPGVLWAARNGPASIFRLEQSGSTWVPSAGWAGGKPVRYPDGTGDPDAEGITAVGANLYVATERNNAASGVSRNSILRFDPAAPGTALVATHGWNLTADLPVTGPNLGMEAITFVPDTDLVAAGFVDQRTNALYDPAVYADHDGGLFFVGLEANGVVYVYALDHTSGAFARVATIATPFPAVMDLTYDTELGKLWVVCDDTCLGRTAVLDVAAGMFDDEIVYERPTGMPNLNNEGFTIAPLAECANGTRPVYWSDDSETGGIALRAGRLTCPT